MPETVTQSAMRPGDVFRYQPESTWCHDGWAIAEERRDGRVVLVDTYWGASGGTVVNPREPEFQFNLSDYETKRNGEWERYAPADRRYIPQHSGYQTVLLVRKGATPDLTTEIENARERVTEAEQNVSSAEWSLKMARRDLAELEQRATEEARS